MENPNLNKKSRRGWKILIASGLLLLLLVLLWDWNWFKPLVESQASASLGRKVTIGHMDVALSRQPLIVLDNIVIANPSEFPTDGAFSTIAQLSLRIDARKGLRGLISLPEITVTAPKAALLSGPSGKPNYLFELQKSKDEKSGPAIEIGQLTITDGDVQFVDPKLKSNFRLKIHTEPASERAESKIYIDAEGTYAAQAITGRFIGGSVLSLRDPAQPYPVDLVVKHGATVATLIGTIDRPIDFGGAKLKLDFRGSNLADLYLLTGVPLPPTSAYRLTGGLDINKGGVKFKNFTGIVGDSDMSGDLAIDLLAQPRRKITANVASKKLVMKDLGGAIGATTTEAGDKAETPKQKAERLKKEASGKVLPDIPISLPRIRAADVDATYKAARLESASVPLDDLDLHVVIVDGQMNLSPVRFGVGTGSINANIMLDGRQDLVHAIADVDFRKLDVSHILKKMTAFNGDGKIGGVLRIDSTGNSVADMLGRGDGEMKLFMSGGDISALLVNLMGLDLGNSLRAALGIPRRAELHCMVADMGLKQGQVSTRTLLVDTTEANIIGGGSVNLRDELIDYRLKTEPKHINIGSVGTPINIKGTLKDPKIRLEAGALTARGAAALALGTLFTPLAALIPTIQLGLGEDNDCGALLKRVGAPQPAKK
ncbi:AsmA family protein [Stenotrophobium rhamnosiphilum]|uniref:AsmA family protein n=1 Tax=Stenotrophobium rhamnosiphilum TaxID=2029166 RepID=A0A2T5MC79_9GAMM|nr:AsmA family protein [Stenotrophobium rhamnosiphilum]PTU30182.1 AsmA family protein [Stenotrophobium rhamnosiphilum]